MFRQDLDPKFLYSCNTLFKILKNYFSNYSKTDFVGVAVAVGSGAAPAEDAAANSIRHWRRV